MASKFYTSEKWLRRQHYDLKKSVDEIAEICGTSSMTIRRWMEKFNMKIAK